MTTASPRRSSMSQRRTGNSHTGCAQCKRRKVKCDEATPACGACVRRQERCSFLQTTQYTPNQHCYACGGSKALSDARKVAANDHSLLGVDLTHFFLVKTLPSILSSETKVETWRRSLFIFDDATDAVALDAQLVTAAMHKLAVTNPTAPGSSAYFDFAVKKQAEVLSVFVPMLSNPTPEQARTLFVLAALVAVWCFASRSLPPQLSIVSKMPFHSPHRKRPGQLDNLVSMMRISQGIGAVVDQCRSWLTEQGLSCMIESPPAPIQPVGEAPCRDLDVLILQIQSSPEYNSEMNLYDAAIRRTKEYLNYMCVGTTQHVALGWPVGLSPEFMTAVSDHEPAALVIVAFWAACLHHTRQWWAPRWGEGAIAEIRSYLPQSWHQHLEWPMVCVQRADFEVVAEDGIL